MFTLKRRDFAVLGILVILAVGVMGSAVLSGYSFSGLLGQTTPVTSISTSYGKSTTTTSSALKINTSTLASSSEPDPTYLNAYSGIQPETFLVFTQLISATNYYFAEAETTIIISAVTYYQGQIVYGGVGNAGSTSGTNARAVLQAAISALPSYGGEIVIGPGTYPIDTTALTLHNGLTLSGTGYGNAIIMLQAGTARPIINSGSVNNVTITGLTFNGNSANEVDPASRGAGELVIIDTGNNGKHLTITNNVFEYARTGAALDVGGTDILEQGNAFFYNGVLGATYAADCSHLSDGSSNVRIANNNYVYCTDTAVAIDDSTRVTITGNALTDSSSQLISIAGTTSGEVITGNTLQEVTLQSSVAAIAADTFGLGGTRSNVTINGNTITDKQVTVSAPLIELSGTDGAEVVGNTLTDWGGTTTNQYIISIGLNAASQQIIVANNNVIGRNSSTTPINGIRFASTSYSLADGNTVYHVRNGIGVSTGNTYLQIYGNQIEGVNVPTVISASAGSTVGVYSNQGYNPVSKFADPFGATTIGEWGGSSASPTASTTYTIIGSGVLLNCAGGTAVDIVIYDSAGAIIETGATSLTLQYIPMGDGINFGPFTGGAPTVGVSGTFGP